jgi:F-type H+-transporting ATPase subunit b
MRIPRRGRSAFVATLALPALVTASMWPTSAHAAGDLVLVPQIPLVVVLIALFVLLIFPVNALVFKPIFSALDERSSRIQGARQRAEHIQEEATTVLQRYESTIREARADAETIRREQISAARDEQTSIAASARQQAEAKVEQARSELSASLGDARESLRGSAQELARTAAEQVLGRTV